MREVEGGKPVNSPVREKVIAVMDRPRNCQECIFGVCKYSHPFWSRENSSTKGYYCQLLPPEQRVAQQFDYDSEVHLDNCPLVPVPEKRDQRRALCWEHKMWMDGFNACIDVMGGKGCDGE